METLDGFKIIECSGTAYEIGFNIGVMAGDHFRKAFELLIYGLRKTLSSACRS